MLLFGVSVGVATTTIYAVAGRPAAAGRARDRLWRDDDRIAPGPGGQPGDRRLHWRNGLRMVFVADVVLLVVVGRVGVEAPACGSTRVAIDAPLDR